MTALLEDKRLVFITGPAGSGTTMLSQFLSAPRACISLTRFSCTEGYESQSASIDELTHRMWHVSNADKEAMRVEFGQQLRKVPIPGECTQVVLKRSCPFTNINFMPVLGDVQTLFPGTRFIIAQRDPRHSAASILRRKICSDIETAVNWTKMVYGHLQKQLRGLPPDAYRIIRYDVFTEAPEASIPDIERFLSLPEGALNPFRTIISTPTRESSDIVRQHAVFLDREFDGFRSDF